MCPFSVSLQHVQLCTQMFAMTVDEQQFQDVTDINRQYVVCHRVQSPVVHKPSCDPELSNKSGHSSLKQPCVQRVFRLEESSTTPKLHEEFHVLQ